jgi:hypothetical protein
MKKKTVAAGLLGLSLAFAAGGADARTSGVKLGILNCDIAPGVGLLIGSSKNVRCTFRNRTGRLERYHGSIDKIGLDLGVTGRGRAAWLVFAPGNVGRSALSGTYVGGQASASVIVGLGANVLVGGFKNNINLQPISVQGQTGLNIAIGVASLNLRAG